MMTTVRGDVRQRGTEMTWLVYALGGDLMNMMVIVIMMAIKRTFLGSNFFPLAFLCIDPVESAVI